MLAPDLVEEIFFGKETFVLVPTPQWILDRNYDRCSKCNKILLGEMVRRRRPGTTTHYFCHFCVEFIGTDTSTD